MANNKGKSTKNARLWTENELELFVKTLPDPENNFAIPVEKLALKKSAKLKYSSISKIILRWKWIKKIFKQNNVDQVKDNATKLESQNTAKI